MAPKGSEMFEKPVEKVEKKENDKKMQEIQKAKEISKKKDNLKDELVVKEMRKKVEKSDTGLEMQKEQAESKKLDDAVYRPEEMIETEGDYKQSEGIEQAFVRAVDKPSGVIEAEVKPDTTTGDEKQPQMETYEEISAQPVLPSIEAEPKVTQEASDADTLVKEAVASSVADAGAAGETVKPDEGVELKQPVMKDDFEAGGVDPRAEDVGFLGEIGEPESFGGDAIGDELGDLTAGFGDSQDDLLGGSEAGEGGLPDLDPGGKPSPGSGKYDDVGSLTGITDGPPGTDLGTPGMDTSTPPNKQGDLSPGGAAGGDPRVSADGGSGGSGSQYWTNTTDNDGKPIKVDSGGGSSRSSEWSGVQEWTDTSDSGGNQEITGHEVYDDGESVTTVETTHSGGTTTQTVTSTNKETGETVSETSTDNGETTTTTQTTTSSNGQTTTTTTVTNNETGEVVSESTTTSEGSGSEGGDTQQSQDSTPNPEDSGGDHDFSEGGTIPVPVGNQPINQPLTQESVSQPPEGADPNEPREQQPFMSFEEAMKTQTDPYSYYTEDQTDVDMPTPKVDDVDKDLVDPPEPEN